MAPTSDTPTPETLLAHSEQLIAAARGGEATRTEAGVAKAVRSCMHEALDYPDRRRAKADDAIAYIDHVPVSAYTEPLAELRELAVALRDIPEQVA